jgi:hypothetical protein
MNAASFVVRVPVFGHARGDYAIAAHHFDVV